MSSASQHSVSDFDYLLPPGRIAQSPASPRESANLMIVHRNSSELVHRKVADLPSYFKKGDVIVVNNTKVFHARLHGKLDTGASVELFLVRPHNGSWLALGKPGKKMKTGMTITIAPGFSAGILSKNTDGTILVHFDDADEDVIAKANRFGDVPVPPYIKKIPDDRDYQTVYAKYTGSVAAPTAGFHLTRKILSELRQIGVTIVEITLHVGLGTFMPMKSETLESHTMHSEWAQISAAAARTIAEAKQQGNRIIAVGTTTVRTLEGVAALHNGRIAEYSGDISLFITPGFSFTVIDAMLTNFHLPKSTLIVLVSAFAGRETILGAYTTAVEKEYRFYSFGDAMLILP